MNTLQHRVWYQAQVLKSDNMLCENQERIEPLDALFAGSMRSCENSTICGI